MQENKKQRRKKWKRTHRLYAVWKRVAYDVWVAGHEMLPSKAIRAISTNCPRKVDWNARSKGILVQVFQLNITMYKNEKEENRNGKDKKKRAIPLQ